MKTISSIFVLALVLAATTAMSAGDVAAQVPAASASPSKGDAKAGKQKANAICSGCHGIAGTKVAYPEVFHVPRIGGQNEAYLVAALNAYRAGERYNATMKGLASALTEKDVMDIAAYYAGIESVK